MRERDIPLCPMFALRTYTECTPTVCFSALLVLPEEKFSVSRGPLAGLWRPSAWLAAAGSNFLQLEGTFEQGHGNITVLHLKGRLCCNQLVTATHFFQLCYYDVMAGRGGPFLLGILCITVLVANFKMN